MLRLDARRVPPPKVTIEAAAGALREGAVIAVPTDTVYGLAVDPTRDGAVEKLFALKGRPRTVAIPVLVAGPEQVAAVAGKLESAAERLADRYWPGPLTLVVPRTAGFDVDLGGGPDAAGTVGVRWPDHAVIAALCRMVGPLAVTSANRHGAPPAETAADVVRQLASTEGEQGENGGGDVALVVDGGPSTGAPSTVVACGHSWVRCLREGALPFADLEAAARRGNR